jgi:hypothetical protein
VTSFDSTTPFRQAFKDDHDNYYALDRTYTAVRVPQVDGNNKLKARIRAGRVRQAEARDLEQACLRLLRAYDAGTTHLSPVLDALRRYDEFFDGRHDRTDAYRDLLTNRPWQHCPCGICATAGIDVAIFRAPSATSAAASTTCSSSASDSNANSPNSPHEPNPPRHAQPEGDRRARP